MTPMVLSILMLLGNSIVDPPNLAESVLRVYDLRPLMYYSSGDDHWAALQNKAPFNFWGRTREDQSRENMGQRVGEGTVVDFLTEVLRSDFEYEGRSIGLAGDENAAAEKLVVFAPPSVQSKVEMLLKQLEQTISPRGVLLLDLIQLTPTMERKAPTASVLSKEEAAEWIASIEGKARRKSYRFPIEVGRTGSLDDARQIPVIYDYDVEVATAACITNPQVKNLEQGVKLFFRATPLPGGTLLALFLRNQELREGIKTKEVPFHAGITLDNDVKTIQLGGVFQSADVFNTGYAINTFLPRDGALCLQSKQGVEGASAESVLILRIEGETNPSSRVVESAELPSGLVIVNGEAFHPPFLDLGGSLVDEESPFEESPLIARIRAPESNIIEDILASQQTETEFFRDFLRPWMIFVSHQEGSQPAEKIHSSVLGMIATPELIQIKASVRRKGPSGEPLVEWTMPVRIGQESGVLLGTTGDYLFDYDVQIAQNSTIPDPVILDYFDGVAFAVHASRSPDGKLLFDVKAKATLRNGPRKDVDVKGQYYTRIEQVPMDTLHVQERVVVSQEGGSRGLIVFGGQTAEGGSLSLVLEIE